RWVFVFATAFIRRCVLVSLFFLQKPNLAKKKFFLQSELLSGVKKCGCWSLRCCKHRARASELRGCRLVSTGIKMYQFARSLRFFSLFCVFPPRISFFLPAG